MHPVLVGCERARHHHKVSDKIVNSAWSYKAALTAVFDSSGHRGGMAIAAGCAHHGFSREVVAAPRCRFFPTMK